MPNICGFLDASASPQAIRHLDAMIATFRPAPVPDTYRKLVAAPAAVAAGPAAAGSVAVMASQDGMLVVLEGRPHWGDATPPYIRNAPGVAEGIALGYRELGPPMLRYLQGPFALAILIPDENKALLAIDRMGIRPLAYGTTAHGIAFASSLRSAAACAGVDDSLSPQALHDYLYFHMVPSPESIFRGVSKLPPAHYALYQGSRLQLERYWAPRFDAADVSVPTLHRQLREQLEQAMTRQLDHDHLATTGAFLSGGLDSSTVVGLLAERNARAPTYTIGFDAEGYDEIPFARQSTAHYHASMREYYVTPSDVADAIDIIAQGYDEPFGNASAIPSYYCARLARGDGCTALIAGDGGDELFAGNERYLTQQVFSRFGRVPAPVRALLKLSLLSNDIGENIALLRKARSYVRQAGIPLPDRLNTYNFLRRSPAAEIFSAEFLAQIDTTLPDEIQRREYHFPDAADSVQRMLYLDWKFTLADNDLRKVVKACELAGIEVRFPMLDDDLVRYSTTIPPDLLLCDNNLRDFYKQALKDFLPPHTIGKKKHGFGLPFGIWMSSDRRLQDIALGSLTDMKQRGIFNPAYLDRLLDAQRSQHASYFGVMIWVVMMLERWLTAAGKCA